MKTLQQGRRIVFVTALGLLLMGLSGRIDLSKPFLHYSGCPTPSYPPFVAPIREPFCIPYSFQTNDFIMFILFIVVMLIGWSYLDKYLKARHK